MVGEFETMMRAAIDFRVELASLQRFQANFAAEPDVVIPTPFPAQSGPGVLTMELIEGSPISSREQLTDEGFDVDALVQRTIDAYLEMLFRDGIFHADPHPGNFLLEVPNKVAFLDFGDIGRLTAMRRRQIEDLMLAVGLRDADSLTDALSIICHAPPTLDRERFGGDVDQWMARYLSAGMGEFDVPGMISQGSEILHGHQLHLPSDLVLVFRVLIRLQGLAQSLEVKTSIGDAIQPYLSEMMQHRFDPRRIGARRPPYPAQLGAADAGPPRRRPQCRAPTESRGGRDRPPAARSGQDDGPGDRRTARRQFGARRGDAVVDAGRSDRSRGVRPRCDLGRGRGGYLGAADPCPPRAPRRARPHDRPGQDHPQVRAETPSRH